MIFSLYRIKKKRRIHFMPKLQLKYALFVWPNILLLLLVLAGCGDALPSKGEGAVTVITPPVTPAVPTVAAVPVCKQAVCLGPSPAPGIRKYIDTFDNIHAAQIFTYNINNAAQYAKNYDFVWGADPGTVADFRAGNPNIFLSYYMTLNRDTGVFGNQDVAKQHSLSYWQSLHPDWILYKCDRTTPAYEIGDTNIMPFDMTNNDFINWQVQTYAVPASFAGYDAIAADNLNLDNAFGACGSYHNGKWVQRYTGQDSDPQWEKDMLYWVTQMQVKLHALPHPLALIPNLGYYNSNANRSEASDPILQQIIDHVDGVLDESGFTNYGDSDLTGNNWVNTVQLIQQIQQKNKPYYILDEFKTQPVNQSDTEWALSSYLMAKGHLSALFYSGNQEYGSYLNHPEYNAQIGMPISDMFQDQDVYWRLYSNGVVLANPSASQSFTVNLHTVNIDASTYIDLYGKVAGQTITLAPHSGIVLLKKK
jgi:Hypothetical glycosyl hydrolase family 15